MYSQDSYPLTRTRAGHPIAWASPDKLPELGPAGVFAEHTRDVVVVDLGRLGHADPAERSQTLLLIGGLWRDRHVRLLFALPASWRNPLIRLDEVLHVAIGTARRLAPRHCLTSS